MIRNGDLLAARVFGCAQPTTRGDLPETPAPLGAVAISRGSTLLTTPFPLRLDHTFPDAVSTTADARETAGLDRSTIATRRTGETDADLSEEPSWVVSAGDIHGGCPRPRGRERPSRILTVRFFGRNPHIGVVYNEEEIQRPSAAQPAPPRCDGSRSRWEIPIHPAAMRTDESRPQGRKPAGKG